MYKIISVMFSMWQKVKPLIPVLSRTSKAYSLKKIPKIIKNLEAIKDRGVAEVSKIDDMYFDLDDARRKAAAEVMSSKKSLSLLKKTLETINP